MDYAPAFNPQKLENLAIAITAVALGKADHDQPQIIIIPGNRSILHRVAGETDHLAGPPF